MSDPRLSPLTPEQCHAFRRLPLSFDDMVRAIHAAGADSVGAIDRARAGFLADRLAQLAHRFNGAGNIGKDLAEAATILKGLA